MDEMGMKWDEKKKIGKAKERERKEKKYTEGKYNTYTRTNRIKKI